MAKRQKVRLDNKPKSSNKLLGTQLRHKDIEKLKITGWKDIADKCQPEESYLADDILETTKHHQG